MSRGDVLDRACSRARLGSLLRENWWRGSSSTATSPWSTPCPPAAALVLAADADDEPPVSTPDGRALEEPTATHRLSARVWLHRPQQWPVPRRDHRLQADDAGSVEQTERGRRDHTNAKLAAVAEAWFADFERQDRSPTTVAAYRDRLDKHILPALGNVRVRELTVGLVDRHLRACQPHRAHETGAAYRPKRRPQRRWPRTCRPGNRQPSSEPESMQHARRRQPAVGEGRYPPCREARVGGRSLDDHQLVDAKIGQSSDIADLRFA